MYSHPPACRMLQMIALFFLFSYDFIFCIWIRQYGKYIFV